MIVTELIYFQKKTKFKSLWPMNDIKLGAIIMSIEGVSHLSRSIVDTHFCIFALEAYFIKSKKLKH